MNGISHKYKIGIEYIRKELKDYFKGYMKGTKEESPWEDKQHCMLVSNKNSTWEIAYSRNSNACMKKK